MDLPRGRISGKPLRALVSAVRKTPARHIVARVLRRDLGIDAVRELPNDARANLMVHAPLVARHDHARPSLGLELPKNGAWPHTIGSLGTAFREGRVTPEDLARRALAGARALS